jgi:predicted dehydrogenase
MIDDGVDLSGRSAEIIEFETCNQYTIQGDLFSKSVRNGTALPSPLEDSVRNMAVIEALFRSAKSEHWEVPQAGL